MKFYQCMKCGRIIQTHDSFNVVDEMYAKVDCDCGGHKWLYLCDDLNDVYIYYDPCLDERFYYYDNNTKL